MVIKKSRVVVSSTARREALAVSVRASGLKTHASALTTASRPEFDQKTLSGRGKRKTRLTVYIEKNPPAWHSSITSVQFWVGIAEGAPDGMDVGSGAVGPSESDG